MKKLLLFSAAGIVASLNAQITITETDLPQGGYTYYTYTDTTPSISVGTASASAQTWNFSSLGQDYPSVPTYGFTSWTNYASAFPASNIYTYGPAALYSSLSGGAPVGSQGMNKGYMFWRTDYNGFHIVGFRADSGTYSNVNVQVNPNELLIGTPATYNNSFSNSSAWTFPMSLNAADYDTFYVSRTVKTLTYDAWGDITTPFSYFPSVLRMHEHYVKTDSVYIRFNNMLIFSSELIRDTANNYMFLANNLHYPVAIVHADASNNISSVEYYSGVFTGNNDLVTYSSAQIFPNPFSQSCTIVLPGNFSSGQSVQLLVTDLAGKTVRRESFEAMPSISFDKGGLPEGIYLYTVMNAQGQMLNGKLNIIQ